MLIVAEFFDPNSNGWDITDVAAICALIVGVAAAVAVVRKAVVSTASWFVLAVRDIVREEIESHTKLIQPTSNGGKSLPDIAKRTDRIERMVVQLAEANGIPTD